MSRGGQELSNRPTCGAVCRQRSAAKTSGFWPKPRIDSAASALDAAPFLVPVLPPGFFKSDACRSELERFLDREKQLKRKDLILPVYYVDCAALNEAAKRDADPL